MRAHAHDLRVEVGEAELADALEAGGWREAPLSEKERALCAWAEKLTLRPAEACREDLDALRELGWSDRELHDACQVVAYFNYVNRLADGLGVEAEPDLPWER